MQPPQPHPVALKDIEIGEGVEMENRYDVTELLIAIAPLIHANTALPDKVLSLLLALIGVVDIRGERHTDSQSELRGKLDTYPELHVLLQLRVHESALSSEEDESDSDGADPPQNPPLTTRPLYTIKSMKVELD